MGASNDTTEVATTRTDPTATTPDTPAALLDELAVANRILFHQGVVDGFGHVSLRHPARPDCFLLARSMAPALVTVDDIICFGPDGEPLDARGRPVYLERFIHSEIFRARPEVMSVVHSHSPSVVPFSVVRDVKLCPICHMSGFLAPAAPVFEIRDTAGPASDMLIRDRRLGEALARSLGPHAAVLMRGHGSTVVGTSLRQAVFRAVYTEVNARLQAEAMRLGTVTFLTDAEAAAASRTNDGQIDRAWNLWRLQVEGKVRALP
jgi:HCOMODA/2-hydroxy-3-carboxy-muconic semialdehyde decarboxylase